MQTTTSPNVDRVFREPYQNALLELPPEIPDYRVSEYVWAFDGKVKGLAFLNYAEERWEWADRTVFEAVAWCPAVPPELIEVVCK